MEKNKTTIWQDALKPGLILSLIFIIFSVIIYVFDLITMSLFAGVIIGLISLILFIVSMYFLIKLYRDDKLNGIISYGKALSFGIIMGLYSSVILTGYNYIFNTVIDKDYEKNITIKMQEKTEEYMISKGVPDDTIEQQMKKMEEQSHKTPIKKATSSFMGNFIFAVIAALIAAAIAKKNPDAYQAAMQDIDEE